MSDPYEHEEESFAALGKRAERNRAQLLEAMKAAEHTADNSRLRFGPVGNYAKKIKGEK